MTIVPYLYTLSIHDDQRVFTFSDIIFLWNVKKVGMERVAYRRHNMTLLETGFL